MSAVRASFLLPLVALALQGCVAAVIPLAAAGMMTTTVRDDPNTSDVETKVSTPAAADVQLADQSGSIPASEEGSEGLAENQLLPETREAMRRSGLMPGAEVVALDGVSELPRPAITVSDSGLNRTYTEFADYALEVAAMDPLANDIRPSALLARPGILTADRAPCRFVGNAVLIDLDPMDGPFDTNVPVLRPALATALARLRDAEVEIVWGTALTADRAGDVRRWLRESELDPAGRDRLLLLRYPEDRKQTRREEAASERCLIAMLGDERADFDELFDYLKRPDAAIGLDAMLGKGWFLAPVSQAIPNTEGLEE